MRFGFALPQVGSAIGSEDSSRSHSALKTWVLTASGCLTGYCGRSTRKRLIPHRRWLSAGKIQERAGSVGDVDVRRRAHTSHRARHECPQPSLVQSRLARASADDGRCLVCRTVTSWVRHRMVARRIRGGGCHVGRARQTRRRTASSSKAYLDHRSGRVPR